MARSRKMGSDCQEIWQIVVQITELGEKEAEVLEHRIRAALGDRVAEIEVGFRQVKKQREGGPPLSILEAVEELDDVDQSIVVGLSQGKSPADIAKELGLRRPSHIMDRLNEIRRQRHRERPAAGTQGLEDTGSPMAVEALPLAILGLTSRAQNLLTKRYFQRHGRSAKEVPTIGDILAFTIGELGPMRSMGPAAMKEIVEVLALYGLVLGGKPPSPEEPNQTEELMTEDPLSLMREILGDEID